MASSRLLSTILLGSALTLSFAGGVIAGSPPGLPETFNQAASVGQLTPKQAVKACLDAQAGINTQITSRRVAHNVVPQQNLDFHCSQAEVNSVPAPAPSTVYP